MRSTVSAMSRNPIRPSRKAWTAISLAALSTVGAPPPRISASRAMRSAGNRRSSGGLEGQAADRRQVEPLGRRGDAARPGQRIGDRRAHVGRAEMRQHRAVAIDHEAVDDRLRMHDDVDPLGGSWNR